jgi:hypothetical protein
MTSPLVQGGTLYEGVIQQHFQPTLSGVTGGDFLISFMASNNNSALSVPTDTAGQTWLMAATGNAILGPAWGNVALAYLPNAIAGTHTLNWDAGVNIIGASILTEWTPSILGLSAAAPAANQSGGNVSTFTSSNYTPATASEIVFALMMEQGNAPDSLQCGTIAFRSIGGFTDAGGFNCLMINQNQNGGQVGEANATIVTSTAPVNCNWNWAAGIKGAGCVVAGFTYQGPLPPASYPLESNEYF